MLFPIDTEGYCTQVDYQSDETEWEKQATLSSSPSGTVEAEAEAEGGVEAESETEAAEPDEADGTEDMVVCLDGDDDCGPVARVLTPADEILDGILSDIGECLGRMGIAQFLKRFQA